jgi:hypothetical protein
MDYGLSAPQLEVICALSSGASLSAAAEQAGIHRNTLLNWRRNSIPFQFALADAQYDRALFYREKTEALADLALQTLHDLLADPNTPPSVRLRAALAVLQTISKPPPPKKNIQHHNEKLTVDHPEPAPVPVPPQPAPQPETLHKNAQPTPAPRPIATPIRHTHPKVGRNEACPCGSGLKFKRCCIDKAHLNIAA